MAEEALEESLFDDEESIGQLSQAAIKDEIPNLKDQAPAGQAEGAEEREKTPVSQVEGSSLQVTDQPPPKKKGSSRQVTYQPSTQVEGSSLEVTDQPPPSSSSVQVIHEPPSQAEGDMGEETDEYVEMEINEISPEEHEENIAAMRDVLEDLLELAAQGKLPEKRAKSAFVMQNLDFEGELLPLPVPPVVALEEEAAEEDLGSSEESLEEKVAEEEEEAETASLQEAWNRRQLLLEQFDAVHDEAQRLRVMNMLLHSKVLRSMHRRTKAGKSSTASTTPTVSRTTAMGGGDTLAMCEALERDLLEAGEVRRELEAEMLRSGEEDQLRQRLNTARRQVGEKAAQLQQLQDKAMSKLRATPSRREEADQLLKRVWPQLLRLRKERLAHTRAAHKLEVAREQVAGLEVFGPQRSVAAYEQMVADGVKLAERVQERTEQMLALRNNAEHDLQQAAHLREALRGAHQAMLEAHRNDICASIHLDKARKEVLQRKKKRDILYKESNKLTRQMELLAYPDLLHDHEEVRRRLHLAHAQLEKLRTAYVSQEKRIAVARKLLMQREANLRDGVHSITPHQSFVMSHLDARCGSSLLDIKHGH